MNTGFYRSIIVLARAAMFATFTTPVFADAPAPDKQTAKYEIKLKESLIDQHARAVICTIKAFIPS